MLGIQRGKPLKLRVKITSRPDQRNSSTMINKSTKESQSIAQINANTQPNNKATKLSNREEQEEKTSTNHCFSAKLISPNSDLVSKIRPVRIKSNEFRTCCRNFSPINGERICSAEFTAIALWKTWTEFSLYLSLYVLGLSVCSDSIVLPLSLFYSLLSTRLSEIWASQILDLFST